MRINRNGLIALVAGSAVAAFGGGAALATSGSTSSSTDGRGSFLRDVAGRLDVSEGALEDAMKAASVDQVEAAQKAGDLTSKEAEAIESRIRSGDFPLPGPPGLAVQTFGAAPKRLAGPGKHFAVPPLATPDAVFGSAASYLGVSSDELRKDLVGGKTLAEVARSSGKSVVGLKSAIAAGIKAKLDEEVKSGDLTSAQEQDVLGDFRSRLDDLVNGTPPPPPPPLPLGGAPDTKRLPPVTFGWRAR